VNPAARGVKRRYLGRAPFWRTLLPDRNVRITRTLAELDQAVAEFRTTGLEVVATLGGDGSLHHLADSLVRAYEEATLPIVLALAGGTMNGLPRSLGSGGSPDLMLRRAIAALATRGASPLQTRHLLRIDDEAAGKVRHGFGFGAGLLVRAFEEYYRHPEPGLRDAVRATLLPFRAALFGGDFYRSLRLEVEVDGASWLADPHTVVASVTENPLLWFRPFGSPLGGSAAFHLAVTSMRPRELAPRLWSIFRGRCRHPRLRVAQANNATLRGEGGYLIDGDLYRSGNTVDLRLTSGPPLRFLAPLMSG
jgi:hypothetical protein